MSGCCTGEYHHTTLDEIFAASQALFNCHCSSFPSNKKPFGPMDEVRQSTHAAIFISSPSHQMLKRHQSNPRNTTKNEGEDKHMNTTNGSGVGCEIELPDGRLCRVATLGRCATCGRAFCLTHQGRYYNYSHQLVPYVDMCAPCAAVKQAEEARRQEEARAPYEYFESGAARTGHLTSREQSVQIYSVHSEWKTGLFGLGGRNVCWASPWRHLWQF